MRKEFIADQFDIINRNFTKNWLTPERQSLIMDHAVKIGLREPAFQRAIEHFVKNDEKPNIVALKLRMNVENERSKNFTSVSNQAGLCSICEGNSFVWVKDQEKVLVMNCTACRGSEYHTPLSDIPYFDGSLEMIASPVLKAIKKVSQSEKSKFLKGEGEMVKIFAKVKQVFRVSRDHFKKITRPDIYLD